jgi:hypothetical protein
VRNAESPFAESAQRADVGLRAFALVGLVSLLFLLASIAAVAPAQAATTHVFDSSFKPAVATPDPHYIAVDESTGDVLVRDDTSIYKFDANGTPSDFSALGTNKISLSCGANCNQIAIDNSDGPNRGVIYVSSRQSGEGNPNRQIYTYLPNGEQADSIKNWGGPGDFGQHQFCGVATDRTGGVYVYHKQGLEAFQLRPVPNGPSFVDRLNPGPWVPQAFEQNLSWPISATLYGLPGENVETCRLGASSAGDIYYSVFSSSALVSKAAVYRVPGTGYNYSPGPDRTLVDTATNFAVDVSNDDFYANRETSIARYDADLNLIETFGSGTLTKSIAVAVNSTNDTVYATDDSTDTVYIFKAVTTPDVRTDPAEAGQQGADLSGEVDPLGAGNVTDCKFEYGTTTSYGSEADCTPDAGSTPFSGPQAVSAILSGLEKERTYHYRLIATNANGTTKGPDQIFTTHNVADLSTDPATELTQTSARLNGSFSGDGDATTYHFEWGSTASYGNQTPEQAAGSPTGAAAVSATVDDLKASGPDKGTYHYRVVATNSSGTTVGLDRTFTTKPPDPPTIGGTGLSAVTPTSATAGAQINPRNGSTVYTLEYGTSLAYGAVTPTSEPIGEDSVDHPVAETLTDLTPGTTYHLRVVATNFGGTTHGPSVTFTTPDVPSVEGSSVADVSQTSARLNALVTANASPTTARFEYGTSSAYGQSTMATPIGSNLFAQQVEADIPGLAPGTEYHFRVVATNGIGTTTGPDQSFATQPVPQAAPSPSPRKCRKGFVKRRGDCVKKKKRKSRRQRNSARRHG